MSRLVSQARTSAARAALTAVCEGFFADLAFAERVQPLRADDIPAPFDRLLVHNDHMTTTLEAFYGQSVRLRVLDERFEKTPEETYTRKILLQLPNAGRVVEFGIARIHLPSVPPQMRAEIRAKQTPLGDILIRHEVLRRIEPQWFYRFADDAPFMAELGSSPAYGRVGTITCEGRAAIDLLEVVVDARPS